MTKKHFIELADTLRLEILPECDEKTGALIVRELGRFCKSVNGRFDRARWEGYIRGECGPSGGKIAAPEPS